MASRQTTETANASRRRSTSWTEHRIDPRRLGRPAWIEVDLDKLAQNIRTTRAIVGDQTRLMAVVKGNAYGHGAQVVAAASLDAGADELAVATVGEGVALREYGLTAPILVLGPISPAEIAPAIVRSLSLATPDPAFAAAAASEAERHAVEPVRLHVKLDTGMNRFGGTAPTAIATARFIAGSSTLRLAGLFTHFATADDPDPVFPDQQLASLREVREVLEQEGIRPECVHAANSAAILRDPRFHLDMVRLGISLYGLPPSSTYELPAGFRPVLSVKAAIARVIDLAPGDSVSYGRTYIAPRRERAALVPIGYADGLRRALSNAEVMAIGGKRSPIRGRVCMDQTVIGLPHRSSASVGDVVDVIGSGESGEMSFNEAAVRLDTLSYELVAALAPRLPRYFLKAGVPVVVSDLAGIRRL